MKKVSKEWQLECRGFFSKLAKQSFFFELFFNVTMISLLAVLENTVFCLCTGCHLCYMMVLVILLEYSDD